MTYDTTWDKCKICGQTTLRQWLSMEVIKKDGTEGHVCYDCQEETASLGYVLPSEEEIA